MTITNTSSISAAVNRKLQTKFLQDTKPLCHYFIGSRAGDVMPAHSNTFTMLWRRYDNLTPTVTALTEDTGTAGYPVREGTQLTVTDVNATLAKYGAHAVLTEELNLRDITAAGIEILEVFARQGGRSLNRLQRNILEDNLAAIYTSGGTADNEVNSPITRLELENVINTLDRNVADTFLAMSSGSMVVGSTPVLPSFWGICHSDVAVDIAKLKGFKGVETYASHTATSRGEFGMVMIAGKGVRFISTPEASIDTGSGATTSEVRNTAGVADLYSTVIFGMNCHGAVSLDVSLIRETYRAGDKIPGLIIVQQPLGSAGTADPLKELSTTGWKAWHTGVILDGRWGRSIRSAASKLS